MLRLTVAATVKPLTTAGWAVAAPMSAAAYDDALKACDAAATSAKRDDCLRDARNAYQKGATAGDPAAGNVTGKVDDALPDRSLRDGKKLGDRKIGGSVPDKLKN